MWKSLRRRRLLERLERGELDAEAPELLKAMERDPLLARELFARRARQVARAHGADEASPPAQAPLAPGAAPPTGNRRPERELPLTPPPGARLRSGPPPGQRVARRRFAAPIASLLVLLFAAGLFLHDYREAHRTPSENLGTQVTPGAGGSSLVVYAPEVRVDDYSTFRFDGPLPPGGWFEVDVRDADGPEDGPILLSSGPLQRGAWEPPTSDLDRLPDGIAFTIRILDAQGREVTRLTQRSRRDWLGPG